MLHVTTLALAALATVPCVLRMPAPRPTPRCRDASPGRLAGIDFCTTTTEKTWNIYGHLTDAVFVKPYRLHWGSDPTRFIEAEEACVEQAVTSSAPRPALWIPERFKRERHIEAPELRMMAWNALLAGSRGIRYHFWKNDRLDPFRDCPGLEDEVVSLDADIRKLAPILSALVPVRAETDRRQGVKVREAWSGDAGVLLLVRDMLYSTDATSDDDGKSPRFQPGPTRPVTVAYALPPWLTPGDATDPLTDAPISMEKTDTSLTVTLPEFSLLQLVWIPNVN